MYLLFCSQDGSEHRNIESLSLIDAVMPDIVANRQNVQNHAKNTIKMDPEKNGEEGKLFFLRLSTQKCDFLISSGINELRHVPYQLVGKLKRSNT